MAIAIGFPAVTYLKVQGPIPANLIWWVWIPILVIHLFLQVLLIADSVKNKPYNKGSWISTLAFTGLLGSMSYLMQRDKLIAMVEK